MAGMAYATSAYRASTYDLNEESKNTSYSRASESGHDIGKRLRSEAKSVFRPVLMVPQQLGRRGRQATIAAITRSLPGIIAAQNETIRKQVEELLRDMAAGRKDANEVFNMPDHLEVVVELSEDALTPGGLMPTAAAARGGTPTPPSAPPAAVRRQSVLGDVEESFSRFSQAVGSTASQVLGSVSAPFQKEPPLPDLFDEFEVVLTNVSRAVAQGAAAEPEASNTVGGGAGAAEASSRSARSSRAASAAAPAERSSRASVASFLGAPPSRIGRGGSADVTLPPLAEGSEAAAAPEAAPPPRERKTLAKLAFEADVDIQIRLRPGAVKLTANAAPGRRHVRPAEANDENVVGKLRRCLGGGRGTPEEAAGAAESAVANYRRLADADTGEAASTPRAGAAGGAAADDATPPVRRCPLLSVAAERASLSGRIRIWWELKGGILNIVFLPKSDQADRRGRRPRKRTAAKHASRAADAHTKTANEPQEPSLFGPLTGDGPGGGGALAAPSPAAAAPVADIKIGAIIDLCACLPVRVLTDKLIPQILVNVLAAFTPETPLRLPLEVPVALSATFDEDEDDEKDSLASLHGAVREATRVLQAQLSPINIDSAIPRA